MFPSSVMSGCRAWQHHVTQLLTLSFVITRRHQGRGNVYKSCYIYMLQYGNGFKKQPLAF